MKAQRCHTWGTASLLSADLYVDDCVKVVRKAAITRDVSLSRAGRVLPKRRFCFSCATLDLRKTGAACKERKAYVPRCAESVHQSVLVRLGDPQVEPRCQCQMCGRQKLNRKKKGILAQKERGGDLDKLSN